MADKVTKEEFKEVFDQLAAVKHWQVVRGIPALTMLFLLQAGYFKKVQYTPYANVWQVRLTAQGRDYA